MIGLLKKKAIWYVILRAIREKARPMISNWEKKRQMDLSETLQRTSKRLNAIQKWLAFDDTILDRWKQLAGEYLTWLSQEAKRQGLTRNDVSDNYPTLWRKFLQEKGLQDDFMTSMIPSREAEEDVWKRLNDLKIDASNDTKKRNEQGASSRKTKQSSELEVVSEPSAEEEEEEEEEQEG